MRADLLHTVMVYANPVRWASRLQRHTECEQHLLDSGVRLTTVECAYGDRPYELPEDPRINRVRVRAKSLVWNKENLMNLGISRLPDGWEYVCCVDGDIHFRKPNWASEAVHALQQYDVIQPWSDAYDLGPNDEHLAAHRSFCRQLWHDQPVVPGPMPWWDFNDGPYCYPHSGYVWCYTRLFIEWLGGLIEHAIMGAADHHMALSLVGKSRYSIPNGVHPNYYTPIKQWEQRALHHINGNIGFLWGTIEHRWHGRKAQRKYIDRWDMVVKHQFDPMIDLKRNSYGVTELAGNKPGLRHDLDKYFRQRNEDANTIE